MKRFTAAVLALMLVLCGCGQKSVNNDENNAVSSESVVSEITSDTDSNSDFDSETDTDITEKSTDTSSDRDKDGSIDKKTKEKHSSDKDTDTQRDIKKSSDTDKKSSDKDTDTSKSKTTSSTASSQDSGTQSTTPQTYSYTVGDSNDPIRNVAPENVQQYIIDEPVIVTDPEPESTFVNQYEDVDPNVQVDDSWFDDCVIIGDSLTVGLSMYNDANGVFGDAKFVCASSLSYWNCQWDLYAPGNVHPYYNGQKILVEDAAVVTGANKAIITLGMNDIGIWGPEGVITHARTLLNKIRAKSPNLRIYFQTVTPMIYGRQKTHLNNQLIRQFNANLKNFAAEENCGFLNSYDAFADSNGNLPYDLCSDPGGLGLHFNFKACKIWTEFIKTNIGSAHPIPEPTPEVESKPEPVVESDVDTDTEAVVKADTDTANESVASEN